MIKKIAVLFLLFSSFSFAGFLEEMQKIDMDMQNMNYEAALEKSKKLQGSSISEEERASLDVIIKEINEKMGAPLTDDSLNAESSGTLLALPFEEISDGTKFEKYKAYEKQILETGSSEAINSLALLYIKENLYEKAMNLALKDKTNNPKNLYLAATAARMIGNYDKAIELYNKVLNIDSSHAKSYLGLAMAHKLKGDYKLALNYLKTYSKYDSSSRIIHEIKVLGSK